MPNLRQLRIFWGNVKDPAASHEALPVREGEKWPGHELSVTFALESLDITRYI